MAETAGFQPGDLAAYLEGRWRFERRILDAGRELVGRVSGIVRLRRDGVALVYREDGTIEWQDFSGKCHRVYHYRPRAATLVEVYFEDGRLFHRLDLSQGPGEGGDFAVSHSCPPDRYRGAYRFRTPARWSLRWRVEGPRKDYTLETDYARDAAATPDKPTATP